ncbi:hypothetical protein [Enterovibrio nigricans]|uniref:hypothetical protein n=1 Tax=Enterovibrio nigricans TaxID=504469 RepID=UPI001482B753|nr:hypothetical protein [Enterovibrio nigricans]
MSSVENDVATLIRGVLDTQPEEHINGEPLLFLDGYAVPEQFIQGETVRARALTVTPKGELPAAEATILTTEIEARAHKPFPVNNVRIDGKYWADEITLPVNVTWSHRNRLSQVVSSEQLQSWFDDGTPEADVVTRFELINAETEESILSMDTTETLFALTEESVPVDVSVLTVRLTAIKGNKTSRVTFKHSFNVLLNTPEPPEPPTA